MQSRRCTWVRVPAVFALTLMLSASVSAQSPLGRLAGTVFDTSGAVLPGATATLTNEGTGQTQSTVSNETGAFLFPQVPVGSYKLEVSLPSFKSASFTGISIAVGQEYSLTARLALGNLSEVVSVEAGSSLVPTTTPEINQTVDQKQIETLPLNGRNPIELIRLMPGVPGIINRTNVGINGGRPTWTELSQDGINIQDNFIRINSLEFVPNRPTTDNVAEFSITTAVQGADNAGGATQVRMVTPSGTNTFKGNVYEYNRHSRFAANSFFNKRANPVVPVSYLNRNQFGGSIGGPIQRGKLFFYANYEGFRQSQQTTQNVTIPARADLLTGNFRYVATTDGTVRQANILQLTGQSVDAKMQSDILSRYPGPDQVNSYDSGDSRADRILNTGRYRFQQDDLNDRNQWLGRADYELNSKNRFEFVYSYIKETDDRTDLDHITLPRPLVFTEATAKRFVGAWRWAPTSRLQNELRIGGNLAPVAFESEVDFSSAYLFNVPAIAGLSTPLPAVNTVLGQSQPSFQPQGRNTRTYQVIDNASYVVGDHQLQFGGSLQMIKVNPYNFAARFPALTFGFSPAAPASVQLTQTQLPGISGADLLTANNLLAFLTGTITSLTQTLQVQDQSSGFVAGIPNNRNYSLNNVAAFVQDNWRLKSNVTLRAGLKWEYFSPLREDDNLGFQPILNGRSMRDVMLDPAASVTFIDGDMYGKDLNNFGPTIGLSWDPFKDGRTAIRGGYSLAFVNEETVTVGAGVLGGNAGLSTAVAPSGLYARLANGVPAISVPQFKSTRTLADQLALSATGTIRGVDESIRQPHVHQVSAGISREILWNMGVEARYVGTFGRDIFRGIDLNQMNVVGAAGGAFLQDFARARQNGFLSLAAGLAFDPAFAGAGSQGLTVLPQFGQLANATVRSAIQQNEPARLADFYISNRIAGANAAFLPNPGIYASEFVTNGSFTNYHALQLELRRQFRNGISGQINYTWSETRADALGATSQNRIEPLLDNARPELDEGRSLYHVGHVINSNVIVELPFGRGRRWLNGGRALDALVGGWQTSAIVRWQSGSPVSIESNRGTFNRVARSDRQTAVTSLSAGQVRDLFGVRDVNGTMYFIDPKVIDTTGRAVGPDTLAGTGFNGQVFFNPGSGEVGSMQMLAFDGPPQFVTDFSISKRFRIGDRYGVSFRADIFNLFNTVNFEFLDPEVNNVNFGRLTATNTAARLVQFSGKIDF
jgi:hypothetical protein